MQQCYIAGERQKLYKFEYGQNNSNSSASQYFRFIMTNLLIVRQSKKLNRRPFDRQKAKNFTDQILQ